MIAYQKVAIMNDKQLLESFLSFQTKPHNIDTYSEKHIITAYNYAIELIFIHTHIKYNKIRSLNTHKQYTLLDRIKKLLSLF